MRIVYFNHNVAGTGTYLRAYRLAHALARLGHDMSVVTTSPDARVGITRRDIDGVTVIEAPDLLWGSARTGWDPWNTLVRCMAGVSGPVDFIHAFDSRPAVIVPALYLRRRTGARLAMDWADWWGRGGTIVERETGVRRYLVEPVETWFEERFRKEADLTTTISRALSERVVGLGVARSQVHVVPQGCIKLDLPTRADARRALRLSEDEPIVLHVGAAFRSDLNLLLNAFRTTRKHAPEARLVMVGKLPVAVPPQDGVTVLGRVSSDDLSAWLAAADACVLPMNDTIANRGRWPSKINEYLAAGRAIAMTQVGDVAEWMGRERCGLASEPYAAALGEGILRLLSDVTLRREMEGNARRLAEGPLSWGTIAAHVDALYRSTCAATNVAVLSA